MSQKEKTVQQSNAEKNQKEPFQRTTDIANRDKKLDKQVADETNASPSLQNKDQDLSLVQSQDEKEIEQEQKGADDDDDEDLNDEDDDSATTTTTTTTTDATETPSAAATTAKTPTAGRKKGRTLTGKKRQ